MRRGVGSVPLGAILMWRQGNVEVQLEGVNVLLRQRRDDTVTKETITRSQEQNIRGAMQQMRTLGGAKEEEVAGAPIILANHKGSIKAFHNVCSHRAAKLVAASMAAPSGYPAGGLPVTITTRPSASSPADSPYVLAG